MLALHKTFGAFDRSQKPFGFVCVNRMLDIFLVRHQLKVFNSVIAAIKIFVVYLQSIRNWTYKSLPQSAMDANFSVFAVFARRKNSVAVYKVRLDRPSVAIASPSLTVLDVERGGYACSKKSCHSTQRSTICKHILGGINLLGTKQFAPRYASNARKIADFVKAFVAADRFPNLHAVDIKPVYVGGQA